MEQPNDTGHDARENPSPEQEKIDARRKALNMTSANTTGSGNWALALSGGGIRSATFCLGVLQALACTRLQSVATKALSASDHQQNEQRSLLERFDYLSTVSGGGYIGSFFCSLFIPGRLVAGQTAKDAAAGAYKTLAIDPPGRIEPRTARAHPHASAMAWLRENGRYLTPTGAGDFLYVFGLLVRNWLAVHYVLGSALLFLLSMLAVLRYGLACWPFYSDLVKSLLANASKAYAPCIAVPPCAGQHGASLWWSELWWLPTVPLVYGTAAGIAYWLVFSRKDAQEDAVDLNTAAMWCAFLLAAAFTVMGRTSCLTGASWSIRFLWGFAALSTLLALVMACRWSRGHVSVSAYRVKATRHISRALGCTLALSALALADTFAQSFYLYSTSPSHDWATLSLPAAASGLIVGLVHQFAALMDEKKAGWIIAKLPSSLLAGLVAGLLALMLFTLVSYLVLWIRWNGDAPHTYQGKEAYGVAVNLSGLVILAAGMTLIAGKFNGFLNLSSLQSFYAARLTRAYLGATNGTRFTSGERSFSVAEPVQGDQVSLDTYYDPKVLAPVHLINITMNETTDVADQIVQRDRKGVPLCIAPSGQTNAGKLDANARFLLADQPIEQHLSGMSEINQRRHLGDWIATSGAAISTGLGRTTSLGMSLLFGLANVRLGTWWAGKVNGTNPPRPCWLAAVMKTQYYLFCELTARFRGMRCDMQYLSDGGHFENTAVYELLRPARAVRFIVVCDCGADPAYEFGDLANLLRLVRVDLKAEIVVNERVLQDNQLLKVFGRPEELAPVTRDPAGRPPLDDKCALLLDVFQPNGNGTKTLAAHIIVLKPRLIASAPADVHQYQCSHADFPQQTTADQFFDEAQWESYRKLGMSIGHKVFGDTVVGGVGQALYSFLYPAEKSESPVR